MYNFQPTLKEELVLGKRFSNPLFEQFTRTGRTTFFNFTSAKVYENMTAPEIKIPKMHSYWIPKYLRLRKRQEIGLIDDGVRLYLKFPVWRFLYRVSWLITLAGLCGTTINIYYFISRNSKA
ncbi:hypothetical protein PGB90_001830 [Kerria lacca]